VAIIELAPFARRSLNLTKTMRIVKNERFISYQMRL